MSGSMFVWQSDTPTAYDRNPAVMKRDIVNTRSSGNYHTYAFLVGLMQELYPPQYQLTMSSRCQ